MPESLYPMSRARLESLVPRPRDVKYIRPDMGVRWGSRHLLYQVSTTVLSSTVCMSILSVLLFAGFATFLFAVDGILVNFCSKNIYIFMLSLHIILLFVCPQILFQRMPASVRRGRTL